MTLRPSNLSCNSNYYVSRQILGPPPLWLQKHSDLRTHDFAHSINVWHQPRLSKVTCAWSWRLCVINPTIRADSTNCTAPNRFSHYSLYRFFILTIKCLCNFYTWYYNRNHKIRTRSKNKCPVTSVSSSKTGRSLHTVPPLWLNATSSIRPTPFYAAV
jgi:hypothetical protein